MYSKKTLQLLTVNALESGRKCFFFVCVCAFVCGVQNGEWTFVCSELRLR